MDNQLDFGQTDTSARGDLLEEEKIETDNGAGVNFSQASNTKASTDKVADKNDD